MESSQDIAFKPVVFVSRKMNVWKNFEQASLSNCQKSILTTLFLFFIILCDVSYFNTECIMFPSVFQGMTELNQCEPREIKVLGD